MAQWLLLILLVVLAAACITGSGDHRGLGSSAASAGAAANDRTARVPILMYHHVNDLPADAGEETRTWTVGAKSFAAQMQWLDDHGWKTISCALLADHLARGVPLPVKSVILTFDDGWDCGYSIIFPILQQHHFAGTFFVYPNGINAGNPGGYMSWDQLKQMDAAGMEIASHTMGHPCLPGMAPADVRKELTESKRIIEEHLGHPATVFAYPYGQFDGATVQAVKAAGYMCALGIEPGVTHHTADLYWLRRNRVSYGDTIDTFKELFLWP